MMQLLAWSRIFQSFSLKQARCLCEGCLEYLELGGRILQPHTKCARLCLQRKIWEDPGSSCDSFIAFFTTEK